MICWFCLSDTEWDDSPFVEGVKQCNHCHMPQSDNGRARADRFMALVAASIGPNSAGPHGEAVGAPMTACWAIDQAAEVMANIERRVLDGTLFCGEEQ